MIRDCALVGMTGAALVGQRNDRIAANVGNVQIAKSVQNAAHQVDRERKQRQRAAQTARQSEAEVWCGARHESSGPVGRTVVPYHVVPSRVDPQ